MEKCQPHSSEVSENDTLKLLCGLKESKAVGPDKINAKVVKDSAEAKPSMFADDTNISASAESVDELEDKVNTDLSNIYQWLVANKLTLNVSKTEYMIIGSRNNL
ncbi:Hypothetical predicted protein, partial [Paramuricea clavata]